MKDNNKMRLLGAAAGLANGFFGSGGGIIAVPMLKKAGFEPKKAHACSLALTLPLSAVSALFYLGNGSFDYMSAIKLIPFGLAGAVIGTFLMKRISVRLLSGIFGLLLVIAGVRNLFL